MKRFNVVLLFCGLGIWGTTVRATDTNPPVIVSFVSKISAADTNGQATVPDFTATLVATDDVTPSNSLVKTQSPIAGTVVGVGTTVVTLRVSDAASNVATATTTFVVIDDTPPIITTCAPPVTNSLNANCQLVVPDFTAGVHATDNVTPANLLVKTQLPLAGSLVNAGVTIVTIAVMDQASNTSTCVSQLVMLDTVAPVISACAGTVTNLVSDHASQAAVPDFTAGVQAMDNCTANGALIRTQSPTVGTMVNLGTTAVHIIIADAAGNSATCTANFVAINPNLPVIVAGPAVTNALLQIGNRAVVISGETSIFSVTATNLSGLPLNYEWHFGDDAISAVTTQGLALHTYTTNCGPYTASVTVSNDFGAISSNLAVAVACELITQKPIGKVAATVHFLVLRQDSAQLKGRLDLGPTFVPFTPANLLLTVDIGGVPINFTLDKKGRGLSPATACTCRLVYTKPFKNRAEYWTLTVNFNRGSWRVPWAADGLLDQTFKKPGVPVTLPVVVIVGAEAFASDPSLLYISKQNKSGTAK